MILKIESLASLAMLFVFILLASPLLFSIHDLSTVKGLEAGCRKTYNIVAEMPYIIQPTGRMTVIELPSSVGKPLDTVTINGTLDWVVRIKCEG